MKRGSAGSKFHLKVAGTRVPSVTGKDRRISKVRCAERGREVA